MVLVNLGAETRVLHRVLFGGGGGGAGVCTSSWHFIVGTSHICMCCRVNNGPRFGVFVLKPTGPRVVLKTGAGLCFTVFHLSL